jgi:hypothetical protein
VTHLRQAMLDELQRRNYATTTVQYCIQAIERFAKHFHRPPDQLNQTHLRESQAYLLRDRKLEPRTVKLHVSALRFFFVKTLKRRYLLDDIPYRRDTLHRGASRLAHRAAPACASRHRVLPDRGPGRASRSVCGLWLSRHLVQLVSQSALPEVLDARA